MATLQPEAAHPAILTLGRCKAALLQSGPRGTQGNMVRRGRILWAGMSGGEHCGPQGTQGNMVRREGAVQRATRRPACNLGPWSAREHGGMGRCGAKGCERCKATGWWDALQGAAIGYTASRGGFKLYGGTRFKMRRGSRRGYRRGGGSASRRGYRRGGGKWGGKGRCKGLRAVVQGRERATWSIRTAWKVDPGWPADGHVRGVVFWSGGA